MVYLRESQIDALLKPSEDLFNRSIAVHLQSYSPVTCHILGMERLLEVVNYGREKASKYGFVNKDSVLFYLECMFLFGSEFDTDPTLSWVSEILNDPVIEDSDKRIDLLNDTLSKFTKVVVGENRSKLLKALTNLLNLLKTEIVLEEHSFDTVILSLLYQVYPERCALCGDRVLKQFIRKGRKSAVNAGLDSLRASAIVVFCILFLGHGFLSDTIYFWIDELLSNQRIASDMLHRELFFEKLIKAFLQKTLTTAVR